jgi:hypothetical protein
MSFMKPEVQKLVMYHVESNEGDELVPEDVCGDLREKNPNIVWTDGPVFAVSDYTDAKPEEIKSIERKEGYYSRLSAPGYLDCTDWMGPYNTSAEALFACMREHQVDENGN